MKLIYCEVCGMVKSLRFNGRTICSEGCGKSWGQLEGGRQASYGGMAIPLGFSTPSFQAAIHQFDSLEPVEFVAFVIEKDCPTFVFKEAKLLYSRKRNRERSDLRY